MLKKILIGLAVLGLTVAALANGNSVPVVTTVPTSEFNPGIYVGLQGGYGVNGWYRIKPEFDVSNDEGLTGRVFVGYDFTKTWALEAGYTYFSSESKIKDSSIVMSEIRTQAFDLVGKLKVSVINNFGVYAKAGVVYLMSKGINKGSDGYYIGTKDKQNNLGVAMGLGAAYYFTPSLWMDLSWTKNIIGRKLGQTSTTWFGPYQPDTDFYALGIAYKFNF